MGFWIGYICGIMTFIFIYAIYGLAKAKGNLSRIEENWEKNNE